MVPQQVLYQPQPIQYVQQPLQYTPQPIQYRPVQYVPTSFVPTSANPVRPTTLAIHPTTNPVPARTVCSNKFCTNLSQSSTSNNPCNTPHNQSSTGPYSMFHSTSTNPSSQFNINHNLCNMYQLFRNSYQLRRRMSLKHFLNLK